MDSDIYEIGDEFVKTFSFDMIVDRNPIYLGMAGISQQLETIMISLMQHLSVSIMRFTRQIKDSAIQQR